MQSMSRSRIVVIFLAGMVCIHVFLWWHVRGWIADGSADFTSMYTAGKMVRTGLSHEIYNEDVEWQVQRSFSRAAIWRGNSWPYVHAPFEALLFVPFSFDPYLAGYLAFAAFNLMLLLLVCFLLKPYFMFLNEHWLAMGMFVQLAFFPIFFTILEGQDVLILVLTYTLVFVSLKKNAWFTAGCCLAFGMFRLHTVLPFVAIMFLLRRWRLLLGFCAGLIALVGVSTTIVGWKRLLSYPHYIWSLEQQRGRQVILTPPANCNLRGVIEGSFDKWLHPSFILALIVFASFAVVWFAAKTWKDSSGDSQRAELAFSVSLIASVLASYHAFMYDLALLILPIMIVVTRFAKFDQGSKMKIGLFAPIAIMFFSPLYLSFSKGKIHHNLLAVVLLVWMGALIKEVSSHGKLSTLSVAAESQV